MGKSFKRNDNLMIDSSAIAIDNKGTSLQKGIKYKIYDSVTDLGLTSGSATIAGAWGAMTNGSILICPRGDFPSSELPGNYAGEVEIIKNTNGVVGKIEFHGKDGSIGDYRMFISGSNNPTGTWVRLPGAYAEATITPVSGVGLSDNYSYYVTDGHTGIIDLSFRKNSGGFAANAYTNVYTISPPPKRSVAVHAVFDGHTLLVDVLTTGIVRVYAYSTAFTYWARAELVFDI